MGLSKGGGAIAFQKVVSTVADLPSPLDAEPGMRIIVRETEEVYGLDKTTRMWSVIGTLKKVGGKRPEELAAHVDAEGNPHKTSFQDVLDAGTVVKISREIKISGNGLASQIRLMSDNSALRVGPDAGSKDGALWLNVGSGKKTILRAVGADGADILVLSTDGIVSGGSATFYGGFKGLAAFEDEIVANEGVQSANGFDLVLTGDKGVILRVGESVKAHISKGGLKIIGALDVSGGLVFGGTIGSSLNPDPAVKGLSLGVSAARWASAAVVDLDVAGQLVVRVPANHDKPAFCVTGAIPGNAVTVDPQGKLGLGTMLPEERLDVRGNLLVGNSLGPRLKLSGDAVSCADTVVSIADGFALRSKGKSLLQSNADGTVIFGDTKVQGDLVVSGKLAMGGISGLKDESITFSTGSASYVATSHTFSGAVRISADGSTPFEVAGGFACTDGDLVGKGDLKGWKAAVIKERLVVGSTTLAEGAIACHGDFVVKADRLVASSLRLRSGKIESSTVLLQGTAGSALFSMNGPTCGLTLEGKRWVVDGVSQLTADDVSSKSLKVEGRAAFCAGKAAFSDGNLALTGELTVAGLALKHHSEELDLSAGGQTKFQIPAGVRVEAVLVKLKSTVSGVRYLQVGDLIDADRFASPSTDLKAGTLIRGLNHWSQSRMVQKTKGPIVVSGDGTAMGVVTITVHYVDPTSL